MADLTVSAPSRKDINRALRYLWITDPDFAGRVRERSLEIHLERGLDPHASHELALFGEVFLSDGFLLNPDDVLVRSQLGQAEKVFEINLGGRKIPAPDVVAHMILRSPYDIRGTSPFYEEAAASLERDQG